MNIKELAQLKQNQKFASGHRSCSGCAFPIIVRTVLAAAKEDVVVSNATGCLEVTSTIYPFTSWKVPWIHNAFENAAATISGVEAAYKALQRTEKIPKDKKIKFISFGGDGGTYDIGLQSLSGALERGHKFLYVLYDNEAYANCLSLDTHIFTKEGLKKITEIKIGDLIYAFDQKTHELILKRCSGIFDNGVKEVYELGTLHHNIKVTSNHPFLTLKKNGRGKSNELVWKTFSELKIGDFVIALKRLNKGKSYVFKQINVSKKGDYKVNKINEVQIPQKTNCDVMEFLGLFVGDGWIRPKKAETGFALPIKKRGRERLIHLCKQIFKIEPNIKDRVYAYINSINVAKFIESLGFGMGAKNKTIPYWIFSLPDEEKKAFIKGLMLSDGYKIKNSSRYVSASFDLLKKLRLLLQTMNYRVGKIHTRTVKKGTKCVSRLLLKDSTSGYICFTDKSEWNIAKYPSQYKYQNFLIKNENFEMEKIIYKRVIKKEPTIDLRVNDEHNFIADGIVVHNTGVQRSSATPYGADTTTTPAGRVHQGKEEFRKDITKIMVAHNIPYIAQASVHNLIDLYSKAEKALNVDGPSFINVLSPCIPGWKIATDSAIKIAKLGVETNFWPLYEVIDGEYTLNYEPQQRKPIEEWLKSQGRFRHLFQPKNQWIIEKIQSKVDSEFEKLKRLCTQ